MAKIDKGTAGLLASLEERTAQIRALEREIGGLRGMIGKLEIDLGAKDEQINKLLEDASEERARRRKAEDTLLKIVPTLDGTADKKRLEVAEAQHRVAMASKEGTIERLREDVHRCLGWIAAHRGQHPAHFYTRPSERFDDSVAKTGRDPDFDEVKF